MIARLMSGSTPINRLPNLIEPRKQAQLQAVYYGSVRLNELPDLKDVVNSIEEIEVRLALYVAEQGRRVAEIDIRGNLQVTCQRCLSPCDLAIDTHSLLAIIYSEDEVGDLPDSYEPWIVPDAEANVYDLIQEEMLLNIPAVSYHEENCIDPALMKSGRDEGFAEETKETPFHVLAKLKKKLPK